MKKIGFLGAGHMGGTMIKALASSGLVMPDEINVYDKDSGKLQLLKNEKGITPCKSNKEVARKSDIIFVAVKPNMVQTVINEIKDQLEGKILVSIAAGVAVSIYTEILGEKTYIVRTMPNLPALVGEGMSVIFYHNLNDDNECSFIKLLFECFGKVEILESEKMVDEAIALTSSSPAYVCLFIEAMADGAVRAGIPRDQAYRMAEQTVLGTAKMLLETGIHPAILKDQVCSPAGTTIEAIASLEKSGFRDAVISAMESCAKKARGEK